MKRRVWEPTFWWLDDPPAGASFWVFKTNRYCGVEPFKSVQFPSGITLRLITDGAGTVCMCGKTMTVTAGQIFCAIPGIVIEFFDHPDACWSWLELQVKGTGAMDVVFACGCSENNPVSIPGDAAEAERCFLALHELFLSKHRSSQLAMALMHELMAACSSGEPGGSRQKSSREDLVSQARVLMDVLPATEVNVNELARLLHVDRTTIQRAFKDVLGISPVSYLKKHRIIRALEFLQATELPVSIIASSSGFASEKYFMRCFREATGMTPTEWRASHR